LFWINQEIHEPTRRNSSGHPHEDMNIEEFARAGDLFHRRQGRGISDPKQRGIFAINQRAGAVWKLVTARDEGHEVGKTRELALQFFTEVMADSPTGP